MSAFAWIAIGLTLWVLLVLCVIGIFVGGAAGDRATQLDYDEEAPEQDLEKAA